MDSEKLKNELLLAASELFSLQLVHAAKWCAEAANGLPSKPVDNSRGMQGPVGEAATTTTTSTSRHLPNISLKEPDAADSNMSKGSEKELSVLARDIPVRKDSMPLQVEHGLFLLAQTYFSCKEFERAARVLEPCVLGNALFLRFYSILISIDRKATEETDGLINVAMYNESGIGSDVVGPLNTRLSRIIKEAQQYQELHADSPSAHLYYLIGIIYNKKKKYSLAQECLSKSLQIFPYNWLCWQELIHSMQQLDEAVAWIEKMRLVMANHSSSHQLMMQFFEVVVLQEFFQQLAALGDSIARLVKIFPTFSFIKVQQFLVLYHGLDYFKAETIFDEILINDPLRLDDLDTFSNMLYVMEKRQKLSFLAQYASQLDKFRPETCCVVANFYSFKCEHEKAIMYYKRALTLNKNCLLAWTLMGHEFVELKNSHAAIESYRRAIDTNPRDFRAWYGLGQAYEVLDMYLYALYYYQRATTLQPLDKRMWLAIGNCYDDIDKPFDAARSFEKILAIDAAAARTTEPLIYFRLAMISQKVSRQNDVHKYMRLCFDLEPEYGASTETAKARLWLAQDALRNKQFAEAYELAKDFSHSNAHDIEEARAIAREARSRM